MTKTDAIAAIMKINPSARPDFLVEFSTDELVMYLDKLKTITRIEVQPSQSSPAMSA